MSYKFERLIQNTGLIKKMENGYLVRSGLCEEERGQRSFAKNVCIKASRY